MASDSAAAPPVLAISGLSKSFGGAHALTEMGITVAAGEVHGLLGENGSGKSTLIKVLAGYHAPEAGRLEVNGAPTPLPLRPGQARELGMSFVHQDLGLVPSLTVLDNFKIGEFASSARRWHISWRAERRNVRDAFARFGLDLDPAAKVAELSAVECALLAIVRATHDMLGRIGTGEEGGALLVLDEPTVFLPRDEVDQLFALVRRICAAGASVLFVSHDLEEVLEITDRITVLRDGRTVGTVETAATTDAALVEMIIGRQLAARLTGRTRSADATGGQVSVAGLSGEGVEDVSLEVANGEIVGLTGLLGSGFETVPYLLFGATHATEGLLTVGESSYELARLDPATALEAGIALLPADRTNDGGAGSLSVLDNVVLPVIDGYVSRGKLARRRMLADTRDLLERFDVRPREPAAKLSSLSGGNQQRALLAKWLQKPVRLLIVHEPTQGVDVGARQQINEIIRARADAGLAVLCASSDYEQLAALCDRVMIFGRGRVVDELGGTDVNKDQIAASCYQSDSGTGSFDAPDQADLTLARSRR